MDSNKGNVSSFKNHRLRSRQQSEGNEPMSMEYNGYRSLLKLTVSAPYVHHFSPSWDHQDQSLKFTTVNYEHNQVSCVEIYAVLEHAKWSDNGLKRCAYGADTVSFRNKRCPSYPVCIGPFPCECTAVHHNYFTLD